MVITFRELFSGTSQENFSLWLPIRTSIRTLKKRASPRDLVPLGGDNEVEGDPPVVTQDVADQVVENDG